MPCLIYLREVLKFIVCKVCALYVLSSEIMQSSRLRSAQRPDAASSRSRSIFRLVKLWDVWFQFSPGPFCVDIASPTPSSSCTLCWPGNNQWKQETRGRPLFSVYDKRNRHLKMCIFGHFPRLGISGFLLQWKYQSWSMNNCFCPKLFDPNLIFSYNPTFQTLRQKILSITF